MDPWWTSQQHKVSNIKMGYPQMVGWPAPIDQKNRCHSHNTHIVAHMFTFVGLHIYKAGCILQCSKLLRSLFGTLFHKHEVCYAMPCCAQHSQEKRWVRLFMSMAALRKARFDSASKSHRSLLRSDFSFNGNGLK